MRTELRRKRVPFAAPKPPQLNSLISDIKTASPSMSIELTGCANQGTVQATGPDLADIIAQLPGIRRLHYLKIVGASTSTPQADLVEMEFGFRDGFRKYEYLTGWCRRIQTWDVRVSVRSASASEADRLFDAALTALEARKIADPFVKFVAILPAFSEVSGLALFSVSPLIGKLLIYPISFFLFLYWRLWNFITPGGVGVWLRPRNWSFSTSGLLSWHPSARAQAIWTVVGGVAGLVALLISIIAWVAPSG